MKYQIKTPDAGKRLDKFLVEKKPAQTRGEIQKIISGGLVLVDGRLTSNHYFLKVGEVVEIKKSEAKNKKKKISPDLKIDVVFENNDFLVVNKPAGLIVHGAPYITEPTLADWLIGKYPELKKVGENKDRPGIMHRLDKDASGLLVVAKNNQTFFHLKKQFQDRLVEKEYVALVYGVVAREEGSINFPLKRASTGHRQAAVPSGWDDIEDAGDLKEALTQFKILKRYLSHTLLSVVIKSGRKHQIRAHFYAYGHPLVGDDLYSTRTTKAFNKKMPLGRIFLAAVRLAFSDTKGKEHRFKIEIPGELEAFLEKIK